MGHEISYDATLCGVYGQDLHREIEENEEYKKRVEQEILALIMMDPSKVRQNKRKRAKDEYDEDSYLNNAQYLIQLWNELKEQWEDTTWKVSAYSNAEYAMKEKYRKIYICPDCKHEIEWLPEKRIEADGYSHIVEKFKCPICGKEYSYSEDDYNESDKSKAKPMEVTVRTFSEG